MLQSRVCGRQACARMMVPTELELAYDHCQLIAKKHARNFYYAFRTLPSPKRRAIYAVYAFCRICDDIADGSLPLEEKIHKLACLRRRVDALSPDNHSGLPIFRALWDASHAYGIPHDYYKEVIDGVEIDLVKRRFADFDELHAYCYKVASVVGLICIEVFGYDSPKARQYAIDMGIGMQLTNILRDVKEDAERNRIYIPQDDMRRFKYTEAELMCGSVTDSFRALMAYQAARARSYFESSKGLFPLLAPDSRACPEVMYATYSGLLQRIEQVGFDVFSRRIGLNTAEKVLLMGRLWAGSLFPMAMACLGRKQGQG